jgi:hypothetical protein
MKIARLPLILGFLVLILSLPLAVLVTTQKQAAFPTRADTHSASLTLSPDAGLIPKEGKIVHVLLNTGIAISDGTDIILEFDGNVVNINNVTAGELFSGSNDKVATNNVTVDPRTHKGVLRFSALTFNARPLNGIAVNFRVTPTAHLSAPADTSLLFRFTKGSTVDCNVAEHGTAVDILANVRDGQYSVTPE